MFKMYGPMNSFYVIIITMKINLFYRYKKERIQFDIFYKLWVNLSVMSIFK